MCVNCIVISEHQILIEWSITVSIKMPKYWYGLRNKSNEAEDTLPSFILCTNVYLVAGLGGFKTFQNDHQYNFQAQFSLTIPGTLLMVLNGML